MTVSSRQKTAVIIGLACLCIVSAAFIRWNSSESNSTSAIPKRPSPAQNAGGETLGKSANGKRVLNNLHALFATYKKSHGDYPKSFSILLADFHANPNAYEANGIQTTGDLTKQLRNSDWQYSDDPGLGKGNTITFSGGGNGDGTTRPDGTPKFGPKEPGTRDVLAYSSTYVHGAGGTMAGYYQVLWDDGTVEDVPVQNTILITATDSRIPGAFGFAFPGQAGLPKNPTTYGEKFPKKS